MQYNKNVKSMTMIAILGAIILVLGFTHIGIIHLAIIPITLLHIPVLIGSIVEGPKVGIPVALIFGLFSFVHAIIEPSPVSFIFMNPIISIIPRIMIGIVSSYSFILFNRVIKNQTVTIGLSAFLGSVTNTILVMGLIYIMYADNFASIFKLSQTTTSYTILGIMLTNGLAESLVGVIISTPISKLLMKNKRSWAVKVSSGFFYPCIISLAISSISFARK